MRNKDIKVNYWDAKISEPRVKEPFRFLLLLLGILLSSLPLISFIIFIKFLLGA